MRATWSEGEGRAALWRYDLDAGLTERGEIGAHDMEPIGPLRRRRFEREVGINRSLRAIGCMAF